MRERTEKEREALGRVEAIFRQLRINKDGGGYAPLLDCVIYAYAFPNVPLTEVVEKLSKENYYLGIRLAEKTDATKIEKTYSEMVHIIKSAIDCPDIGYLRTLELEGMKVILKGKKGEELKKVLLAEIGEKYAKYSNDQKIVLFFVKKILKAVKNGT